VSAIAEGLVGGMAAAAETDGGASRKTEFISGEIDNFKIAFDQNWAVIFESEFCWDDSPFVLRCCALLNILAWMDRLRPTMPGFHL
jgi:hypothetical protein